MLSYRHAFHAGNFADVLKHIVLIEILEHLGRKDAAFEYVDTHAGAGVYHLDSSRSNKLREYARGIFRLDQAVFPELARYFEVIARFNVPGQRLVYLGSPAIAASLLRSQDRGWLFELHQQDYLCLCQTMKTHKKVRVECQDGLKGVLGLLPPPTNSPDCSTSESTLYA